MKKTLLALMLVSSLFVISCGADATKPQDAYKIQKTEIASGTKTAEYVTLGATVDVSSFAKRGEKVTEIIEVIVNGAVEKPASVTKNTDGGIYQFTPTTTSGNANITYKYTKSAIAPIVTKTISLQGKGTTSITMADPLFIFEPNVISVMYNGRNIFDYLGTDNTIYLTESVSSYNTVTVEYQYMDVSKISEKPTKEGAIEATSIITLTKNDAGKTYVCKDVTANTYYYGIVPADGIIQSASLSGATQNDNYKLWLY